MLRFIFPYADDPPRDQPLFIVLHPYRMDIPLYGSLEHL